MPGLMPDYKINLLRDFRKDAPGNWLPIDDYLDFLAEFPELEKTVKEDDKLYKELFGVDYKEVLRSFSKRRSANDFNPDNVLNKPRPRWSKPQITRLQRVSGL